MRQESIDKHIEDLYELKNRLLTKKIKFAILEGKIIVDFQGDCLKGDFSIKFSHSPKSPSPIEKTILDQFFTEYGIEMDTIIEEVDKMISFFEAISQKQPFCEVDLFAENSKPVLC